MDAIEDTGTDGTPGSEVVALTFVVNRALVIEARNLEAVTKIIPFKTTGTLTDAGFTQDLIRNEDTVAT